MSNQKRVPRQADTSLHRLNMWARQLESIQVAQALPLRRDMVTLLTYLRDNRVTGTQSTGNLKLKAVREVTARFVHPPKLDHTIGDRTYKLRTEYDVWPLYFLHTLAHLGGLLDGGPSRQWRLTPNGEKFLIVIPSVQIWLMLTTWWDQVNWLIAYPFGGMGESLPSDFEEVTLAHLLSSPIDTRIPFESFADELIQETRLTWTAPSMTYAQRSLRGAVRRMVLDILANFGVVELEHQSKPLGKGTTQELAAFQITSFGKGLLEAL